MTKTLPDKYIRKAIYDLFNGTVVSGNTINVYDSRYASKTANAKAYVLMSVQSNEVLYNKCSNFWQSDILLEVCTLYKNTSNIGSRLLADDIMEELREALEPDLVLTGSGLTIDAQLMFFPSDLVTDLPNGILFRKFLRLEMRIK